MSLQSGGMPVSRSRTRSTRKKGHEFEKKVARWAKRYFDADLVETNILMNGLRVKRPYEIDVHVYWESGLLFKEEHDLWIECKDMKSSVKRTHIFKLIESAKDIEDACKEGREDFYFDHLAIATTSRFDQDALAYATDHEIACIVYDGKRFRIVNEDKINWLP